MQPTCILIVIALLTPIAYAEPDLSKELPRIPPRSPAESAAMIRTLPGFKAQLVAAEPLVFSPVAIDFDEDGNCIGSNSTCRRSPCLRGAMGCAYRR